MTSKFKFAAAALIVMVGVALMFGLSIRSHSDNPMLTETAEPEILVTLAAATALTGDSQFMETPEIKSMVTDLELEGEAQEFSEAIDPLELDSLDFDAVRDVEIAGNELLLATAGGVVRFFPSDSSFTIHSFPQGLDDYNCFAVLQVEEKIYIGTIAGVYLIDEESIVHRVWEPITAQVTKLAHNSDHFLVGSTEGLYRVADDQVECLLPEQKVIDLSENRFGLFAATVEKGLLYFDGEGWQQRYLRADTSAFAEVNCLQSAFQRLWVGTPKGVFVYDGGSWDLIDSEDKLYDPEVLSLARGKTFMYFGTGSGVFSFFDGSLCPLDWSEGLEVGSLAISAGRYLVGNERGGAYFKTPRRELHLQSLFTHTETLAFEH
jgi:ligand-binding sensor domain-containing protein